jgi:hypothetical protein
VPLWVAKVLEDPTIFDRVGLTCISPGKELRVKKKTIPRINPKFARFDLCIGHSGIHRFGVYALENIPARRVVIEYTGRIRT